MGYYRYAKNTILFFIMGKNKQKADISQNL